MELTSEMKAQLAEQKKQCIFCKIIDKEQDSKIVYEDDLSIGVLDIFPALKGHTVYMQKEHYPIMPYLQAHEFKHIFGRIPSLAKAINKAMLGTGFNVFIANGGVAGQRAPHFLIHFLPREHGDNFFNFMINKKGEDLKDEQVKMLQNNLPIMMQNHFGRNPASWHVGKGDIPAFLTEAAENNPIVYEDEKVLAVLPSKNAAPGHIRIFSKEEQNSIQKLSEESSSHMFYVASFAATAVFEGLGAHGTNIILKSGESDDNPQSKMYIDILPRWQEDSLQGVMWEASQPSYDLEDIKNKIKDKTWEVNHTSETKKQKAVLPNQPEVIKLSSTIKKATSPSKKRTPEEEIRNAINTIKQ